METMVDQIGVVVVETLNAAGYKESTIGNYRKWGLHLAAVTFENA